jgi:hypothetical protein
VLTRYPPSHKTARTFIDIQLFVSNQVTFGADGYAGNRCIFDIHWFTENYPAVILVG